MTDTTSGRPSSSFSDDLNRRLEDPKFRRGYVETSLQIQHYDAHMNEAGTPPRCPSLWRRIWWGLTGQRTRRCTCGCWMRCVDGCDCRYSSNDYPHGGDR